MAGDPTSTDKGFMYWMWFVAAVTGSIFDWVERSGSLNDKAAEEPEEMAAAAAEAHESTSPRPQSMGTYETPEGRVPAALEPQL